MRDWILHLRDTEAGRVRFHIDRLSELGPHLDEPHTRQLDGKLRELRFHLEGRQMRITYWIAPGRRIILLTVFAKTQRQERREIVRAKHAMERCIAENHSTDDNERTMTERTTWEDFKAEHPLAEEGRAAYEDEARISAFREFVYRLRSEAGLTQAELAERMGTTQSAIARMEGGGARPTLETLEKLAAAVGGELVVGVGEHLSENRSIAKLVRDGHAVIRRAS